MKYVWRERKTYRKFDIPSNQLINNGIILTNDRHGHVKRMHITWIHVYWQVHSFIHSHSCKTSCQTATKHNEIIRQNDKLKL